jgi:hypothetical protein
MGWMLGGWEVAHADDAAPFAGTFTNDAISVTLSPSGDGYAGTITQGDNKFPAKATANGQKLQGSFSAGGNDFPFTATLAKDHLQLVTGGKTYELNRAAAGAANISSAPLIMQKQMIHDPFLNKDAYSVMVPDQWKSQGAITWIPGRAAPDVYVAVNNPDNTVGYQQLPRLLYEANIRENMDYMFPFQKSANAKKYADGETFGVLHIEVRPLPASPKDYLLNVLIPKSFPGMANSKDLTVVSDTDMPDYAKAIMDRDPLRRKSVAGRVRVSYTTPKGPMVAEFVCVLTMSESKPAQRHGAGQPPPLEVMWISAVSLSRAPAAQFDEMLPILATIHSSVTVQLPWFNVMNQVAVDVITAQQQAEMKAIIDQGQSILNNMEIMHQAAMAKSDMVSQEIHDKFAETMATHDMMQTREMHYITNTGNYRDPQTGGLVNLSQDYKYHFTNGSGLIVESDNPNPSGFAPNELKSMDRVN